MKVNTLLIRVKIMRFFSDASSRLSALVQRLLGLLELFLLIRLTLVFLNANPASLRAALQVLAIAPGKKMLLLGDMGELGEGAEDLHGEMGEEARSAGVEQLFTVGMLTRATARRFGAGARHCATQEELIGAVREALRNAAARPVTILVKGSRRMQMEKVVAALLAFAAGGDTNSMRKG